jgi:FlaA1/EpsC-like NDP-sugar epimerase
VRYGNVFGSRGSVYPVFTEQYKKNKCILLTDRRMTRFNIFLEDAVKMVDWAIHNSVGGEIFVPKLESFKVIDFIKAGFPDAKIYNIGIRPGEKLHEKMIDESDCENTFDIGKYYAIVNSFLIHKTHNKYEKNKKYKKVKLGFSLNSGEVKKYLTVKKLKTFFKK